MVNGTDIQTDFNNIVDNIGTPHVVYQLFTDDGANYNIYGDFTGSGTTLYVSGTSTNCYIIPRVQETLDIQSFAQRVEGDLTGYFKSGVNLGLGYRVSGLMGDLKINGVNNFIVSGILCYQEVVLDPLNK